MNGATGQPVFTGDFDSGIGNFHAGGLFEFAQDLVQIVVGKGKFQSSSFDLRQIQNIAYKLQQQSIAVSDDSEVFLFFLFLSGIGKQF